MRRKLQGRVDARAYGDHNAKGLQKARHFFSKKMFMGLHKVDRLLDSACTCIKAQERCTYNLIHTQDRACIEIYDKLIFK